MQKVNVGHETHDKARLASMSEGADHDDPVHSRPLPVVSTAQQTSVQPHDTEVSWLLPSISVTVAHAGPVPAPAWSAWPVESTAAEKPVDGLHDTEVSWLPVSMTDAADHDDPLH